MGSRAGGLMEVEDSIYVRWTTMIYPIHRSIYTAYSLDQLRASVRRLSPLPKTTTPGMFQFADHVILWPPPLTNVLTGTSDWYQPRKAHEQEAQIDGGFR